VSTEKTRSVHGKLKRYLVNGLRMITVKL
jgi:hypothetical protein